MDRRVCVLCFAVERILLLQLCPACAVGGLEGGHPTTATATSAEEMPTLLCAMRETVSTTSYGGFVCWLCVVCGVVC